MEILIASNNVHKIREFREMFKTLGRNDIDVLSLHQFPDYIPLEEIHETFQENALDKARHAAKALNKRVVADDSGLVVPILGGAPGVRSRRYAGVDATDAENNQKLLKGLEGKSELERSAYYECAIAFVNPDGFEKCVSGICEGHILYAEKGRHGFGYDPLFQKHDYDKSFAEIDEAMKNRISHRRKAFDKLASVFEMPHLSR